MAKAIASCAQKIVRMLTKSGGGLDALLAPPSRARAPRSGHAGIDVARRGDSLLAPRAPLAVIAGVTLAAGLLASCAADSADVRTDDPTAELTLRLGSAPPEGHPYAQAAEILAARVADATGGRVAIEARPAHEGGERGLLADVRSGTIEMASVATWAFGDAGVRSFDALMAPFLVSSYELERRVADGPVGARMLAGVEEIGLVGLAIHEGGLERPVAARAALRGRADFRGAAIAAPDAEVVRIGLRALGARAVALPAEERGSAMRTGAVAGAVASLGDVQAGGLYADARSVTRNVVLWPAPAALVMHGETFEQLSDEDQEAIVAAADELGGAVLERVFERPSELVGILCAEGITFATSLPRQRAGLARAGARAERTLSADPETAGMLREIRRLKAEPGLGGTTSPPTPPGCRTGER